MLTLEQAAAILLAASRSTQAEVYAVDIDEKLVAIVRSKAPANLKTIVAAPDDPHLPQQSIDMIFFCDVLHHIENRPAYYVKVAKALKPGGRVVVIDFYKKPLPVGPPESMKLSDAGSHCGVSEGGLRPEQASGHITLSVLSVLREALEHFHLLCIVLGAKKEAFAIGAGNRVKGALGRPKQFLFRAGSLAAQGLFDLAPHGLDRIEVRRRRRQVHQPRPDRFEGVANSLNRVRRRGAAWGPTLAGPKPGTSRRSSGHQTTKGRRDLPGGCRRSWCWSDNARAERAPAVFDRPRHGPAAESSWYWLHCHQCGHRFGGQLLMPAGPSCRHVGSVAFGGGQSFF